MPHTPPTPAQITSEVFHLLDANGDGALTLSEIEGAIAAHDHGHTPDFAPLEKVFDHVDTDGNGSLSAAEVTTAVTHVLTLAHDHAAALHAPHNVHDLLALLGRAAHHDWVI